MEENASSAAASAKVAERLVADQESRIVHQRQIVALLERDGHVEAARKGRATLEQMAGLLEQLKESLRLANERSALERHGSVLMNKRPHESGH